MKIIRLEVSKLSNDPANARKHNDRNIEAIIASLRRFGQQKPIVVDSSNVVRAGNGTLEAAKRIGWEHVDCVVTDLKSSDAVAYAIADNRTAELAEWDDATLAAELESLQADGLLEATGFSDEELNQLLQGIEIQSDSEQKEQTYTNKITPPIYEPKGEKPSVSELIDRSKADALIQEIEFADLPADVKQFLKDAAERHVVFNFRNIAEFYCHASPQLQSLMEQSGLIIIDFDKAIECGFVHLSERLGELCDIELKDRDDDS